VQKSSVREEKPSKMTIVVWRNIVHRGSKAKGKCGRAGNRKHMKKNVLVTGRPGCGKTTLIEKIATGVGLPAAGFLTREIRERGKRVGFLVETFDGKKGTLAHVNIQSQVSVGKYGVDLKVIEAMAVPSFLTGSADVLVVVDEIGKMECYSPLFRQAVISVLDSPNPVLASIAERGDLFMEGIKSRKDIEMHKILPSNRDILGISIIDGFRDFLSSRHQKSNPC